MCFSIFKKKKNSLCFNFLSRCVSFLSTKRQIFTVCKIIQYGKFLKKGSYTLMHFFLVPFVLFLILFNTQLNKNR